MINFSCSSFSIFMGLHCASWFYTYISVCSFHPFRDNQNRTPTGAISYNSATLEMHVFSLTELLKVEIGSD